MEIKFKALTDTQVENIHQATMDLLWKYGIAIHSEKAKEYFKNNGCVIDGNIVKIPRALIEKSIKTVPKTFKLQGRSDDRSVMVGRGHDPLIIPAAGGVFLIDENGEKRNADIEDMRKFLKLCHTSNVCGVTCSSVIYPYSDNVNEMLYQQMIEALSMSDKPIFAFGPDRVLAEEVIDMASIGTGRTEGYYVMNNVNSLSPMAWDENMLDVIMVYAERKQPLIIGCCSMSGFTSHIFLENTIVTNNAEVLAGIVLSQIVNPGTPVIYANTSGVADMKKVTLSIGSPELIMIMSAISQLAQYYDIPFRTGGGLTDSKDLDMQAGIESALCLFATLSNETNVIMHSLGTMESFNSISWLKWLMDEETCERYFRMAQPIPDLKPDCVDLLGEVGQGVYFEQPDTFMHFREVLSQPIISDRSQFSTWKEKKLNNHDSAVRELNRRLESYIQPEFHDEVSKSLKTFIQSKLNY